MYLSRTCGASKYYLLTTSFRFQMVCFARVEKEGGSAVEWSVSSMRDSYLMF